MLSDSFGLKTEVAVFSRQDGEFVFVEINTWDFGSVGVLFEIFDPTFGGIHAGLQLVEGGATIYARDQNHPLWIDVTSIFGEVGASPSGMIPLQAMLPEDSDLANQLFDIASGDFDPRDVNEIMIRAGGISPMMNFQPDGSISGQISFVHSLAYTIYETVGPVDTTDERQLIVDEETGLIVSAERATVVAFTPSGSGVSEKTHIEQRIAIAYGPQQIPFPEPGDPSIETDPEVIDEFLEMFQ